MKKPSFEKLKGKDKTVKYVHFCKQRNLSTFPLWWWAVFAESKRKRSKQRNMSTFENREIVPLFHFGGGQSSLNQKGKDENREMCPLLKKKFFHFFTLVVDTLR